jgi:lactate dehydrogenase-like 2-hydroxyacid dehydrogenase
MKSAILLLSPILISVALRAMDSVALQPHRANATLATRTAMGGMVLWSPEQRLSGQRPELSMGPLEPAMRAPGRD